MRKFKVSPVLKITILLFGLVLLLPNAAHAAGYLDPGSGSTVAQGVIAVVAVISRFFRKGKSFFIRAERK